MDSITSRVRRRLRAVMLRRLLALSERSSFMFGRRCNRSSVFLVSKGLMAESTCRSGQYSTPQLGLRRKQESKNRVFGLMLKARAVVGHLPDLNRPRVGVVSESGQCLVVP